MDLKENIDPSSPERQQILEELVAGFLGQLLDNEELTRYEERDSAPSNFIPFTIFKSYLEADTLARKLSEQNLKQSEVEPLFFKVKKSLRRPADPYLFFISLQAIYRDFPDHEHYSIKAFILMARMVMNAPFLVCEKNGIKRGFTSFNYFAQCAHFYPDLILADEERAKDYWQIYFFDEAYPCAQFMSWLTALYDFYWREAYYILNTNDPFSDEEWPILKKRISSPDHFYDLEWIENQKSMQIDESTSFGYFAQLEEYLIKDVNIYWHLLYKLCEKDSTRKADFFKTMQDAGADLKTIINSQGGTALELASMLNLTMVVNERDIEYCEPVKAIMPPKKNSKILLDTKKRKPFQTLGNEKKRFCKEKP